MIPKLAGLHRLQQAYIYTKSIMAILIWSPCRQASAWLRKAGFQTAFTW
jgi:hypothetical protein